MADYTRITHLLDELQQQVAALQAEVRQLQHAESAAPAPPTQPAPIIPPTRTDDPDSIIGGAPTEEFPDCCALSGDGGFCSGTLIAPNLVVTAGHCRALRRVFLKGSDIAHPENGETIEIAEDHAHPQRDIRVLVLKTAATVTPRHVAQGFEIQAKTARLVGFGQINTTGTVVYGTKRMVEVPITSLDCAAAGVAAQFGCQPGGEMVAGQRGLNRDSCHGDSGGPLYIQGPDGTWMLLGATSRGVRNTSVDCGDGGIYVRVDQVLDWIRQVTGVTIEGPQF